MATRAVQASGQARPGAPWAILAVAATALLALLVVGASPYARYFDHAHQPESAAGQVGALVLFVAGWALMMLAMMLPTATSLLVAVGRLGGDPVAGRRLQRLTAAGFLATWIAVGYGFRAGDVLVHAGVDAIGWLESRPRLVGATALLLAGAFQFTPLKHRCLAACRSPTTFVYRHWHGGRQARDAVRIGAAYGASCVGCCWAIMLVLFGLGTASVAWMLGAGTLMAIEKNTAVGPRLSAPIGVALLAAGAWVAL
jgi:predicted metal-binding membrane protein